MFRVDIVCDFAKVCTAQNRMVNFDDRLSQLSAIFHREGGGVHRLNHSFPVNPYAPDYFEDICLIRTSFEEGLKEIR